MPSRTSLALLASTTLALAFALVPGCGNDPSGPGGSGGGTTSTTTSTTSVMMVCAPGHMQPCYSGPAGTENVGICRSGMQTCTADGSSFGECVGEVTPMPAEDCATPGDDDCNGQANEATAGCVCTPGDTAPCYSGPANTEGVGLCHAGTKTCAADGKSFGACTGEVLPTTETCNTPGDDDCNGKANEGGPGCTCTPGAMQACYSGPPVTNGVGPCHGGTQVCNAQGTGFGTCMGEVVPQPETCTTAIDDNCNGQINESGTGCVCAPNQMVACYTGPANTKGVGICKSGTAQCNAMGTAMGTCTGQVLPAASEDCATSTDDNCNGIVNEGCSGVTWTNDARPIFQAHCATCHTIGMSGGVDFATVYADSQLPSSVCAGLTVGACTLVRIKNGTMPQGAGCTGDPTHDSGNPACLTAAEQATLQAWITGGQLP